MWYDWYNNFKKVTGVSIFFTKERLDVKHD
nr:MAG TPA: hypothetical protein [Caudoviricetes sp.]